MHGNKTGKEQTHEGCRGQTTQAKLLLFDLGFKKRIVAEFVVIFAAQVHVLRGKRVSVDTASVSGPPWVAGGGRGDSGAFDVSRRV